MNFRPFALFMLLIAGSCATKGSLRIAELDRPLMDLQNIAAKSMPLGLRKTSPNGREYFSEYFIASDRKFKPAEKSPVRSYAHVLVLGDRRPYTIEVLVHTEKFSKTGAGATGSAPGYEEIGLDKGLAKVVRKRIVQQLNKRREDLNIIDDFRVF